MFALTPQRHLPLGNFAFMGFGALELAKVVATKKEEFLMSTSLKSTALYPHPFSKAYWRDAAAEVKDTKMLVACALLTALRIVLKPLAIPLGTDQLTIPISMLATALGAMIYGPILAVPSAIVSDVLGFFLYPTGDFFPPFTLTEIAGTVIFALFLYRANMTPLRVVLARFCICLGVNVVLQTPIFGWMYAWQGMADQAIDRMMALLTPARIFKNLCMFPLESVVVTLVLQALMPAAKRAGLIYCSNENMKFTAKEVKVLVALVCVGIVMAGGFLFYYYGNNSRSAGYSPEQRVEVNHAMTDLALASGDLGLDGETVVGIVDSAYRPLFGKNTDYTVSIYTVDDEALAEGMAADAKYGMDTLWGYSKSGPGKDPYGTMVKVAEVKMTVVEKTYELLNIQVNPVN